MKTKGLVIVFCLAIILCFVSYLNSDIFSEDAYKSSADSVEKSNPKPTPKKKVINMSMVSSKIDDDEREIYRSILVSANAYNEDINVYNLASKESNDYQLQNDIIKNCINKKYAGIILYKINLDKVEDMLNKARKNDIFILAIKCEGKKELANTVISSEVKNIGKACAITINKIIDKAKVYVLASKRDIDGYKNKEFKENINKLNKNIVLEDVIIEEKSEDKIKDCIENIIKDKNGVCGIFAFDDEIILKAMNILHKKDIYNIWLFAGKGTKELEKNVADSNICFCLKNIYSMQGQKACKCVMDYYKNRPVKKEVYIDACVKTVTQGEN